MRWGEWELRRTPGEREGSRALLESLGEILRLSLRPAHPSPLSLRSSKVRRKAWSLAAAAATGEAVAVWTSLMGVSWSSTVEKGEPGALCVRVQRFAVIGRGVCWLEGSPGVSASS